MIHPLHTLGCWFRRRKAVTEESNIPVDWEAIVRQRERELKRVGEARHRAEAKLDRIEALCDQPYVAVYDLAADIRAEIKESR